MIPPHLQCAAYSCGAGWTNDETVVLVGIALLIGFFLGWLTRRRS